MVEVMSRFLCAEMAPNVELVWMTESYAASAFHRIYSGLWLALYSLCFHYLWMYL